MLAMLSSAAYKYHQDKKYCRTMDYQDEIIRQSRTQDYFIPFFSIAYEVSFRSYV